MKKHILLITLFGIAAIGVAMTAMSLRDIEPVDEANINHCKPDMELLADNQKFLCVTGRGEVYTMARK